MRSILSYVLLAERGRTCTFDLTVTEVTALFTTGKGSLGNLRHRLSAAERRSSVSPQKTGPASRRSSRDRLHDTFGDRRDSNPLYPGSEVSEVFTTSERMPALTGGDSKAAQSGGKQEARSGKAATGNTKKYQQMSRRSDWKRRAAERTHSSPPRHRWTARMPRAPFPPAGPALRTGAPKEARGPGIRVSHPPKAANSGRSAAEGRHEKPLRSGRSGGVRKTKRTCRFRSAGAAPMSRARDRRRHRAVGSACAGWISVRHRSAHMTRSE